MTHSVSTTSCRTLRALECIMSHNVTLRYIQKAENKIADYLLRLAHSSADVPHWEKFPYEKTDSTDFKAVNIMLKIDNAQNVQSCSPANQNIGNHGLVLLLYDNQHIDLHLDFLAGQAVQDTDNQGLINLIRSKESLSDTHKNSPLRQY